MKDILFWTLLLIIFISILLVSQVDGFTDVPSVKPQSVVTVPQVGPPRESITTGDFTGYAPPSFTLLSPPPGGVATVNSLPYSDPSQQKVQYARIKEVLEAANGFLNVEAPNMAEVSDPSVQLPLTTLRTDVHRLNDEVLVLERNPGIESSLTQHDVDAIEANLSYLQKKWRTMEPTEIEGFQAQPLQAQPLLVPLFDSCLYKLGSMCIGGVKMVPAPARPAPRLPIPTSFPIISTPTPLAKLTDNSGNKPLTDNSGNKPLALALVRPTDNSGNKPLALALVRPTDNSGNKPLTDNSGNKPLALALVRPTDNSGNKLPAPKVTHDNSGNTHAVNKRASLLQLKELVTRISVEITRLSASATTDPVVTQRITTLTTIKKAVQGIVDKVISGQMAEKDIPIMESDYLAFLPALSKNGPLPKLLNTNNLPPSLANLLPSYNAGDISGAAMAQYLVKTYGDTFFKGLSWGVNLNYTAERNVSNTPTSSALASLLNANGIHTNSNETKSGIRCSKGTDHDDAVDVPYRGEFATMTASSTVPARLDWKQRSTDICNAIQKRGYNPGDFGCLTNSASVSDTFSWRGYARMVCTRVGTVYDTGAPEAVGCPPLTWAGWRA